MNALAARRRHPAALALLIAVGLLLTGAAYALVSPKGAEATATGADQVQQGKNLFLSNCSSCHGVNAQGTKSGPSLVGVGAAAVDFQVGTGRMPLAGPNVQAQRTSPVKFSQDEISAMGAYVASLGPGPSVPDSKYTTALEPNDENAASIARGGQIFRVNCAMCHNFNGAGGALTRGKYAPNLMQVDGKHIYEAMLTGPQSMPVFDDSNLTPQAKQDVISFLKSVEKERNESGMNLGHLGPVAEGLFAWVFGLAIFIGIAWWLGQKAA